jgi:radical SAM superfamily enzyme YgiQ (UPF0313 family)
MRILLVKPPATPSLTGVNTFIRNESLFGLLEPLELELLAGAVHEADIQILDMRVDPTLEEVLDDFKPDLVGVTCWTTGVYWAKKILATAKLYNRDIVTVIGGHHATLVPSDFFEQYIDIVVLGPGENTFVEIIKSLQGDKDLHNIRGIVYRKDTKFIQTDLGGKLDMASIPLPRRELTAKYRKHYHLLGEGPYYLSEISRGCPYRCGFCAIWKSFNGEYCTRSAESIVNELETIEGDFVYYCDPSTTLNIQLITKILDLIEKRKIKKKFLVQSRVDTIAKHKETISRWADLGLVYMLIGFESFRKSELENYNKKVSIEMNLEALEVLKRNNIISKAQFIVNPEYDEDDFANLIRYVLENDIIAPEFSVLTPLPGSKLYEERHSEMTSKNYELFDFGHCLLPTKLPRDEFYKQYANLYIQSYSPTRFIMRYPLYFADLLVNHWKWHNRSITGVEKPWHSEVRTANPTQLLATLAIGLKQYPDVVKGYEDELISYPPKIAAD